MTNFIEGLPFDAQYVHDQHFEENVLVNAMSLAKEVVKLLPYL